MLDFELKTKLCTITFSEDLKIPIQLTPSSVTNKFHIVTTFIKAVSEFNGEEFDVWFQELIEKGLNEETRALAVTSNIEKLKEYVDAYLDHVNIDYSIFVDETKVKKNSILFKADEIQKIIQLSSYLKVYSIFSNSETLKLGKKLHTLVYNKLASSIMETDIINKIFTVIKTKTFRYNLTDRFMWEYIKTIQCKDIGIHIIEIFNFIMNHILILCEETKNPITYFVGVVDESVKWFLRSVYKGSIVYDDSISTEDIHGSERDNLRTYSFNDTLGRLKGIAFEKIYNDLERQNLSINTDDEGIVKFQNRLNDIDFTSPLCGCLVFPILSQITNIPYIHFKTVSSDHAAVLSYYVFKLLQKTFQGEYKNVFSLLQFFPKTSPSVTTTYRIKAIHNYLDIQNSTKNFFGFSTKILPHDILCHYVGRVSRINFVNLLTGDGLSGIPLSKIEGEMTHFYTKYFAGQLDDKIANMTALMNSDF
jgi:hypothetical protein